MATTKPDLLEKAYDPSVSLIWEVIGTKAPESEWAQGLAEGLALGEARGRVEGEFKGQAKGRAEGEARALRHICADLVKALHPRVATRVLPVIEACQQSETLRAWILECTKLPAAAFAALVTSKPTSPRRSRTSHPSRGRRLSVSAHKGR